MKNLIENHLQGHAMALKNLQNQMSNIESVCIKINDCLENNGKLLICGNGGSASDAQHISAEFVGRFVKERKGLPSIALNTDTSALTAIGNDYGYENIFSRQIESLANKEDILIVISTSGNSKNIISAIRAAKNLDCKVIGLLGNDGGEALKMIDYAVVVPSDITAHIQEMHILIGHIICGYVDSFH